MRTQEAVKRKVAEPQMTTKETGRNDTEEKWIDSKGPTPCHQANPHRDRELWVEKNKGGALAKDSPNLLRDVILQT